MLPQLSCGNTYQIWKRFRNSRCVYCKIKIFLNKDIKEQKLGDPHPSNLSPIIDRVLCVWSGQPLIEVSHKAPRVIKEMGTCLSLAESAEMEQSDLTYWLLRDVAVFFSELFLNTSWMIQGALPVIMLRKMMKIVFEDILVEVMPWCHQSISHNLKHCWLISLTPRISTMICIIMHLSRHWNCWSLRCSWSIACRHCSNYIFILDLTPGFNGLGKGNGKMRWETFKFWDFVCLILKILQIQNK